MDDKKIALIFKAFCDENRIKIIKMLLDYKFIPIIPLITTLSR